MRFFKKILVPLFTVCSLPAFAQLLVTQESNPQVLVQKLVGEGVTVSNVTINGAAVASGTFKNLGGNNLNIDSGIVFSSGRVMTNGANIGMNGNATLFASTSNNTPGDPQLTALTNGQNTNDAISMEFDFVPLGDTIKFRYVFSSEEYPDFNCTNFNDVFAFFISGPGITGAKNLALVPGTNIPVSINSINNGIPAGSMSTCNAMGPGSPFTMFYVTNDINPYVAHDGHTIVLTAISAVTPCTTYHLKIAIADAGDFSYDSGVFLEAKSLTSDPIEIVSTTPDINGLPYMVEGCASGGIKLLRSRKSPLPQPVNLVYAGTAINGVDVQLLPLATAIPANDSVLYIPITPIVDNLPEGTEILKIYVSNGCALSNTLYLDSIEIQVRDYGFLNVSPPDTSVCKNSTVQLSATGSYTSYSWSPSANLSDPTIANPIATATSTNVYVVTAGVGTCQAVDSVTITVKALEFISQTNVNCVGASTGEIKVSGGGEWKAPVQYSLNNGSFGNDSTFSNLPVGTYTIKIKDASGCLDSIQVSITQAYAALQITDSIVTASCTGANGQITMTGSGGLAPYTFSIDGTNYAGNNTFTVNSGNHNIYIKDSNGCVYTKPAVVGIDPPITITIDPDPELCKGRPSSTLHIVATGGSNQFEYSADGTNFQLSDSLYVNTSPVTITVRDNKGCTGTKTITIPFNDSVYVNAGNDTTICEGTSFQFNTTHNATNFTWQASPSLSGTTIPNPVASPVNTTTYYITATKDICTAYDTITVNVNPAPIANAGPGTTICYGRTIQLQGSGGVAYNWTPAADIIDPTSPNASVKPLQTTIFYLEVMDANGCYSLVDDTVKIEVTPPIQAFAGRDTFVAINQPLQLTGQDFSNTTGASFHWSPSTGLNDPDIANPITILAQDMLYTLTITTPEGCEGSDQILVKVYEGPELYVPTAFTPNNDGKNDVLRPLAIGMKEFHYFRVFNRWGQMVFSSTNPNKGWDGSISGVKQSTGTYIWVIEAVDFRGNLIQKKGSSTLIR